MFEINQNLNIMQLLSSLEAGGIEKLLVELVEACQDDDRINITVVIMNQAVSSELQKRLERTGINVYYLNRTEGHLPPRYLRELLKIMVRHQIQVIHTHQSGSKLWGLLCKLFNPRIKLLLTVHDTMSIPRLKPLQLWLHRHCIDQHIAISKTVNELCQIRGIHHCRPIYNGIALKTFHQPNRVSWKERLNKASFTQIPLRIVHVGRMDYAVKGQDILIEAIARCRQADMNVHCRLMGGVYEYNQRSFEELQTKVKDLHLEPYIEFLINRTDVPTVLGEAELFVMPSRFEGLGLALLEAMASGLPVIASNTEGPGELVEDGKNGFLFETGNADDLFTRIRKLYNEPERADYVRQNALQWVSSFDIQVMKEQYYQLWASFCKNIQLSPQPSLASYQKTCL